MDSTKLDTKIQSFEYVLYRFISWYNDLFPTTVNISSFTRLKVLKLLFFVSTIRENDSDDLLDIFDNYWAMQHGPVESDIYNMIILNKLRYYDFTSRIVKAKTTINSSLFDSLGTVKEQIDNSIRLLRIKNENIVTYSAYELVNISHKWDCWRLSMHIAELLGKGSEPMSTQEIRTCKHQYFSL